MSVNVEQVAAVASATAIVATMFGGLFAWIGRHTAKRVAATAAEVADVALTGATATLLARMDHSDEQTAEQLAELKKRQEEDRLEMAKQFGGNSNGLRQAIDGMGNGVAEVREKVANLEGRFDQYVASSK